MELVTEPDIKSGEEAVKLPRSFSFAAYLGISNADMEKGEMRLEANISVRPKHDSLAQRWR
jgi:aspartyl-tRNA(Asn)/glutamyl-tRNA(Gln) amidotransferase subunit B